MKTAEETLTTFRKLPTLHSISDGYFFSKFRLKKFVKGLLYMQAHNLLTCGATWRMTKHSVMNRIITTNYI